MDGALKKVHLFLLTIINSAEARPVAKWPIHGKRVDAEHGFQLVEQIHRRTRRAVQLVHESENRHATAAANFKKFPRLAFNALAGIHHHHGGIHGGEHAVGIFREVLVPGCVQDVDDAIFILELQNRGAHRDPPLLFQVHPVGGGGALVLPRGNTARQVQGAAVEKKFLRQRGFPGVRMGNNRERAAALHLTLQRGRRSGV